MLEQTAFWEGISESSKNQSCTYENQAIHAGTSNFTIFRRIIFFWNFLWPWRKYSHLVKRSWHFFTNVSNSVGLLNDFFVNKTIFDEIPLAWQATRVVCPCYVCSIRLGALFCMGFAYRRAMGMHLGAKGGDWRKKEGHANLLPSFYSSIRKLIEN